MNNRVHELIESAATLSLGEQIDLLAGVSKLVHQTDPDFWEGKSLEAHISEQQTQPVSDLDRLAGNFWPEDESADEFLAFTYRQRIEDEAEN